ncbi:hypothetical protein ILUMI_08547 [Ignelater luminosus]|uniref:C2H2-type domain-containing protein n=1 Tax=Ignelater luminosus TaxID=2038154 RepID=A0A8K0D1G1_IGNLU|nr:hypothetical protein ILUMI_08547 [Ignelater luminosus]
MDSSLSIIKENMIDLDDFKIDYFNFDYINSVSIVEVKANPCYNYEEEIADTKEPKEFINLTNCVIDVPIDVTSHSSAEDNMVTPIDDFIHVADETEKYDSLFDAPKSPINDSYNENTCVDLQVEESFTNTQNTENCMVVDIPTPADVDKTLFKCDKCDFNTKQESSLEKHMLIHSNERPFVCEVCNCGFKQRYGLKRHMRIHTGETPYKCKECDSSFKQNEALKRHMRIHTGEKPFKCPHCDYSATQKKNLELHEKSHGGEKLFKCKECHFTTLVSSRLTAHMKKHTG